MNNEALIATAAAKADAHLGLVDALEYDAPRALRIDGVMHVFAGDFKLAVSNIGAVTCRGYVVSSTARDLAYDVIRAAR
jgi:hypothetical protein